MELLLFSIAYIAVPIAGIFMRRDIDRPEWSHLPGVWALRNAHLFYLTLLVVFLWYSLSAPLSDSDTKLLTWFFPVHIIATAVTLIDRFIIQKRELK